MEIECQLPVLQFQLTDTIMSPWTCLLLTSFERVPKEFDASSKFTLKYMYIIKEKE